MTKAITNSNRTLFAPVIAGFFILLAFLISTIYWLENSHISQQSVKNNKNFMNLFDQSIHEEAVKMRFLINSIILTNPDVIRAFRNRNRGELLNSSRDMFFSLKHSFGITHLYFHDARRVNFLRVHKPSRHGDAISRVTMLRAEESQQFSHGYELGPLGTLTLRAVQPWFEGKALLGYVEMGIEIKSMIKNLSNSTATEILLTVNKAYLHRQDYESAMRMHGEATNWDEFGPQVLMTRYAPLSDELHVFLAKLEYPAFSWGQTLIQNGRHYSIASVPLVDAGGSKDLGRMFLLNDVTDDVEFSQQVILSVILIGLLLMVIILVIIYSLFRASAEQLRKLSQAIEQAGESIVITNKQGVIEYVNPAFTKLTGYSAEEAINRTPGMLKSGKQDVTFYKQMWDTINRGNIWHGKVIDRKKDGSLYPTTLTISPIFDHSGEETSYSHFVGIQSDLTKLEDMEQQFHQAQKMEAIGTLVGGIAHDFNNMLAGITGNLYLAKQQAQDMPDVVKKMDNVEEIAFRASNMIKQLLTFARKDMVSIKQMPLNSFTKETLKLLRTSVPENIEMSQDICSEALQINGDGAQLHQVLLNLINNARDAVEGEDHPAITTRLESFQADEIFIGHHSYVKNQPYAHLSVEDNGIGIPEHQIVYLFDPFFTTKEQGKGTGLGLAMVFGAIKTHHGFVEVESREGQGSTFHVYIPLTEQAETTATVSTKKQEVVEGHGELILLVDDEQHVIETGKEVLESLGYQVLTATDGRQAVEIFEAHAEDIDLVITDVIMPVMGGNKAVQSIRRINPQVKIIFSTGYDKYTQDNMANETVLSKPFSIIEMSHLIREQLDS